MYNKNFPNIATIKFFSKTRNIRYIITLSAVQWKLNYVLLVIVLPI